MSEIGKATAITILAFAAAFAAVAADIPFGPMGYATLTYDGPTGLAVGDVNDDGKVDMVICSPQVGTVRVHYQVEGAGMTTSETILSGLDAPRVLALGDLDEDGDLDVVVGQSVIADEGELLWIENPLNGGGDWTAHDVVNYTMTIVTDIAVVDLDRDGFLDIAFATDSLGGSSQAVRAAWNDGTPDAGWVYESIHYTTDAPSSLAVADIDKDGDDDIVSASRGGDWIRWYDNPRTASGGWPYEIIDGSVSDPADLAIGDFDRDGDPDVGAADETDNAVTWYENDGSWTAHPVAVMWDGAVSLATLDVDGDGDDDLAASSRSGNEVVWFDNDGTTGWPSYLISSSFSGADSTAVGDFDDDGDPDVAAVANLDDTVGWWPNELMHRRFAADAQDTVADGLGNPQGVAAGDLNRDGLTDIVYAEREGDRIVAEISVSSSGHSWATYEVATGFDGARDVTIADMNGDGAPDIVATAVAGNEVAWWSNDGNVIPSWTKHAAPGITGAHSVVAEDLDGDGDNDIAVAGRGADEVRWYRNQDGTGTMWAVPASSIIASIDGPYELASGDLNNDGYLDLVLTAYEGDAVKAFLYDPAMIGFDEYTLAIIIDGPRGIDLADLDGDGDLDAVATISNTNQVRWWANNGTGEVWIGSTLGSLDSGAGVTAADLDGDGDTDVVATSQDGDDVAVWTNRGAATWSKRTLGLNLDTPWSVAVAPIDSDGDVDLVVTAAGNADSVTWHSNVGGQFETDAFPQSPDAVEEDEREAVVYVSLIHHGRDGYDGPLEWVGLTLTFTDSLGAPIGAAQVNDLIEDLEIYRDEGVVGFDPGEDTLFFTDSYLSTSMGVLTLDLSNSGSNSWVFPEEWAGFWVVVHATNDFDNADPTSIIIEVDEELVLANYRYLDVPLIGEPGSVKATGVIQFGQGLFADGFESGGTGAWDAVSP